MNSVLEVGEHFVVKLYRHIEVGTHPEFEIGRFLRQRACTFASPFVGSIDHEWRDAVGQQRSTVGVIHELVPNQGEAWTRSVAAAQAFLEQAVESQAPAPRPGVPISTTLLSAEPPPDGNTGVVHMMGEYLAFVDRLARRVADLHQMLASDPQEPAFAPEPFTPLARRSMYQRIRTLIVSNLDRLHRSMDALPEAEREDAVTLLERREHLLDSLSPLLTCRYGGQRIRCHGNLHLGQVLHAGDDLVIVDFDGESSRPMFERRVKRSPLQDVVSLARSFAYAARVGHGRVAASPPAPDASALAMAWRTEAAARLMTQYRQAMAATDPLPDDPESWRAFLRRVDRAHRL